MREGLSRYWNLRKEEDQRVRPLYRDHKWMRESRYIGKKKKLRCWYGKYDSVIFIPATPGEDLKKRIEAEVKKTRLSIKIVEKSGRSIKQFLQVSDPTSKGECSREDCVVCETRGEGKCGSESVGYRV